MAGGSSQSEHRVEEVPLSSICKHLQDPLSSRGATGGCGSSSDDAANGLRLTWGFEHFRTCVIFNFCVQTQRCELGRQSHFTI